MKFLITGLWRSLRASARRRSLAVFAVGMLASCVAVAAVVSMHPPSGGGELRIPVMLYGDGEETVSGVQFDLNYDPTQFELVEITAGNAATDAGKQVVFSETLPGQGRVLVTGFNNSGMSDGQIATLTLRPLNSSSPQSDIALNQALATDPDGNNVPIDYADLFQYPPPPPEPADPPTPEDSPGTDESTDNGGVTEDGSDPTPAETPQEEVTGTGGTVNRGFPGVFPGASFGASDAETTRNADSGGGKSASPAIRAESPHNRNALRGSDDSTSRAEYPARTQHGDLAPENDVQSKTPSARGQARPAGKAKVTGLGAAEPATHAAPPSPRGARSKDSTLALARPASGLIDPDGTGVDAAYTLAFESAEESPEQRIRVSLIALAAGFPLTLLALYYVLFGRGARRHWRRVR